MHIAEMEARAELARLIDGGAAEYHFENLLNRVDTTELTHDGDPRAEIVEAWAEAEAAGSYDGTPEAIHCQRCGGQHYHSESTCEG